MNQHHLLWYKKSYSRGWAKLLRDHHYCKVKLPEPLHELIHHEVPFVPVPRASSIQDALRQLEVLEDYGALNGGVRERLWVLMALFDCIEPKTYDALKTQYDLITAYEKTNSID